MAHHAFRELMAGFNLFMALNEVAQFCGLLVYAWVLYFSNGYVYDLGLLLVLIFLNVLRIGLFAASQRCALMRQTGGVEWLLLGLTNVVCTSVILLGLLLCTLATRRLRQAPIPGLEAHLPSWFAILVNLVFSTMWSMTRCRKWQVLSSPRPAAAPPSRVGSVNRVGLNTVGHEEPFKPPKVTSFELGEGMPECASRCTICLEVLSLGCTVGMLPCGHSFHDDCIQLWLNKGRAKPRCPMRCAVAAEPEPGPAEPDGRPAAAVVGAAGGIEGYGYGVIEV